MFVKFFYRFLKSNRWFAGANLASLSLCIASSLVLLYFVYRSFSYDQISMAGFGIFNLLLFHANRRMKEIALRKVLGANVSNIGVMLSRELLTMLLVSVFITVTVAYLGVTWWLQGFAYHIQLNRLIFAATLLGLVIIVLAVVAIQSYRFFSMNPSSILKSQ